MQSAINDINYGVAQLIDIRLDVTKNKSDALQQVSLEMKPSLSNSKASAKRSSDSNSLHNRRYSEEHKSRGSNRKKRQPVKEEIREDLDEEFATPGNNTNCNKILYLKPGGYIDESETKQDS